MTRRTFFALIIVLMLALSVAACGGGGDSAGDAGDSAIGDASAGEELFSELIIGAQPGCITCHSLTPDEVIVGPSMAGIGSRAGERVEGTSAEDYLRTSILHPDDYVVEGFQPGVMVQVWEDELTDEQVDNIIAYLLTLK